MTIAQRVSRRLRSWANWRCQEPIVVIESDDWCLYRRRCDHLVAQFGEASEWAQESLETKDDLDALADVLRRHRACVTANVVVANPDSERIAASGFTEYSDVAIDVGLNPGLLTKFKNMMGEGLLVPQYHARRHLSPSLWLKDLQADEPGARLLLKEGVGPALAFRKGSSRRYHAEYLDWPNNREYTCDEILGFLKPGLEIFQRVFGMASVSTIAPAYMFGSQAVRAWRAAGLKYIQGANYRLMPRNGSGEVVHSCYIGQKATDLLMLARHVKFEPRPQRPQHGWKHAFAAAQSLIDRNIPVIIDTHRINYTGQFREHGLRSIDQLLTGFDSLGVKYLSTVELGTAINDSGVYAARVSGTEQRLTPLAGTAQMVSRKILKFNDEMGYGQRQMSEGRC